MKIINIEIPTELHAEFKSEAAKNGKTLKQAVKDAMELWIACKKNNFIVDTDRVDEETLRKAFVNPGIVHLHNEEISGES